MVLTSRKKQKASRELQSPVNQPNSTTNGRRYTLCIVFVVSVILFSVVFLQTSLWIHQMLEGSQRKMGVVGYDAIQQREGNNWKNSIGLHKTNKFSMDNSTQQIIILGTPGIGAHHVSRYLAKIGCYSDIADDAFSQMNTSSNNPFGRSDNSRLLNAVDKLLSSGMNHSRSEAIRGERNVPVWSYYGYLSETTSIIDRRQFEEVAKAVIEQLEKSATIDRNRPWMLRDYRITLTAPLLMQQIDPSKGLCIIIVESPTMFAQSMQKYSKLSRLSASDWSSVWEQYHNAAYMGCKDLPVINVNWDRMSATIDDYIEHLQDLGNILIQKLNAKNLLPSLANTKLPDDLTWIEQQYSLIPVVNSKSDYNMKFVMQSFFSEIISREIKKTSKDLFNLFNSPYNIDKKETDRVDLNKKWRGRLIFDRAKVEYIWTEKKPSWKSLKKTKNEAYITIITGNDFGYIAGAAVNAESIYLMDASRDLVAMVTDVVHKSNQNKLERFGWKVLSIESIQEPWWNNPKYNTQCKVDADSSQNVRWGRMFSKLRLWQQIQYNKILYMDSDSFGIGPIYEIFDDETSIIVGEQSMSKQDVFLAGVMLMRPSNIDFNGLMAISENAPPLIWGDVVDCTEMALLNVFFKGKFKTFSISSKQRNTIAKPTIFRNYVKFTPWVVHFSTQSCGKPWAYYILSDSLGIPQYCDLTPFELWKYRAELIGLSQKDNLFEKI